MECHRGRRFILPGVFTALVPCNHSLCSAVRTNVVVIVMSTITVV
jgi:hypothetical protein